MMENVIAAIGTEHFGRTLFATFQRRMQARQVVVHRFPDGGAVEPLIQESAETGNWVHELVRRYIGGYYPHDPFRPMLAASQTREICTRALNAHEINHAEYREKLYIEPNLAGKLAVILRQPGQVISVSLYRDRCDGPFTARDVNKLDKCTQSLAAVLEKHFSLIENVVLPTVLNIAQALTLLDEERPLSQREASVCARVVMGYTNEAISLDLGLSSHSVATYRKRAYDKLSITSQNELFALLLSRSHLQLSRRIQPQMCWAPASCGVLQS